MKTQFISIVNKATFLTIKMNVRWILNIALVFICLISKAQAVFIQPAQAPSSFTLSELNYIDSITTIPHVGTIDFVVFSSGAVENTDGNIYVDLPRMSSSDLIFPVNNAFFVTNTDYFLQAENQHGYFTAYIMGQNKGATIDLLDKVFTVYPFSNNMGLLLENDLSIGETGFCASPSTQQTIPEGTDYCSDDCGSDILDILILRTPAANQYLQSRYGSYGEWFLFVESYNIMGAFFRSQITNKNVRFAYCNYTPDFTPSSEENVELRAIITLAALSLSPAANQLKNLYKADIMVMLSDLDWSTNGGTVYGVSQLGPITNAHVVISQVRGIDASRFVMAHEIAHHFGCEHENSNNPNCPKGMILSNGRNTILARGFAFNVIQNFSNPNVQFDGLNTGVIDERDNAQQIRAGFCESANNNQLTTYNASILQFGDICPELSVQFSSSVVTGQCFQPIIGVFSLCGVAPYQYQWSVSSTSDFSGASIISTSNNFIMPEPPCPVFYVRLRVLSQDGLIVEKTKLFQCDENCNSPYTNTNTEFSDSNSLNVISAYVDEDHIRILVKNDLELKNMNLWDMIGRNLFHSELSDMEDNTIVIPIEGINPGIYILSGEYNGAISSLKIIIQ